MTRNGTRQFGAFVEPNGIYLVEYKREREGVLILHQHSDPRRVARLADAGERLAAAIQTGGAVDSQLSVAMRGFGSVYQIMVLPAAKPSVLCPVVRREVARLNPEIENPRVNYVMHGEVERRKRARPGTGTLPRELLAAAAPETALSAFGEELSSAGVQLTHLTVLPQVVQRLYQQTDFSNAPTACYIGLESGPLLAFFHDGQLRLIAEPPFEPDEDLASRTRGIVEHLERGKLYLRQKFRGVELNRLLVAVDAPQEAPLLEALREELDYEVERFPSPATSTGALVSMGAILDSESEEGLNLSPFAESPEASTEKRTRRNALAAAGVVVFASIVWGVLSVASALKWSSEVESLGKVAQARMTALDPMRTIAGERRRYAQSAVYFQSFQSDRAGAQVVLRGIARATPPGTQLLSVTMDRGGAEWSVSVTGEVFGESGADVLLGIDRFYHGLPRELAMHDLVLGELDDVSGGNFGAGMKFKVTFVTPGTQR